MVSPPGDYERSMGHRIRRLHPRTSRAELMYTVHTYIDASTQTVTAMATRQPRVVRTIAIAIGVGLETVQSCPDSETLSFSSNIHTFEFKRQKAEAVKN